MQMSYKDLFKQQTPLESVKETKARLFTEVDPKKVRLNLFGAPNPPQRPPNEPAPMSAVPSVELQEASEGISLTSMFRDTKKVADTIENKPAEVEVDAKPVVFGKKKKHIYTAAEKKELGYE
jgi:hypothetical protein